MRPTCRPTKKLPAARPHGRRFRGRTRRRRAAGGGDARLAAASGVTSAHCHELLAAFRQDATKTRYADWGELMGYCRLSASPVGRYLLDLHGKSRDTWPASDALCDALQVINHLQDCADDHRQLDRVYIPARHVRGRGDRRHRAYPACLQPRDAPRARPRHRRDPALGGTRSTLAGWRQYRRDAPQWAVHREAGRAAARPPGASRDPLAERVKLGRGHR